MKYVVVYDMDTVKSAFAFDARENAINYINECSEKVSIYTRSLRSVSNLGIDNTCSDSYEMIMKNGKIFKIYIIEQPNSSIRYDVSFLKNDHHIETRRYTKRSLAVNYANQILDGLGFDSDPNENELGEWVADSSGDGISARIVLELVFVGERIRNEYSILGIKTDSTLDEAKKAFRKMAVKYHPDKGGNQKKFEEIRSAYENIVNGRANRQKSQAILKTYASIDMRRFFELLNKELSKEELSRQISYSDIRFKSFWSMVGGIVLALIGIMLTAQSFNSASIGEKYTVHYGLICVGAYEIFKSLYRMINPKSALKKKK